MYQQPHYPRHESVEVYFKFGEVSHRFASSDYRQGAFVTVGKWL